SSAPTTRCARRSTPAAPARSTTTPPSRRRNSSRSAANTTSATPPPCARRCRRWRRTCSGSTARRCCRRHCRAAPCGSGFSRELLHLPTEAKSSRLKPLLQPGRQHDLELRPAQFLRTRDVQLAAVAADDVLHDRQPDAVALHALVAAHAALQDVGDALLGDARAIVLDHDRQAGPAVRRALA